MRKSGYYDLLLKRINDYFRARTNKAKHQLVLTSDELPLTDTSSSHLHTKMLADDIEYINDGTVDDDLDVWMEILEDYHENGRII